MALYNELSAFAQFSSDLDSSTKSLLDKGAKLIEILKQPQHHTLKNSEHVAVLFAATQGFFAGIDKTHVKKFEEEMLEALARETKILIKIDESGVLSEDVQKELREFIETFKKKWKAPSV